MSPQEAVAHTLWACAEYNAPQPPGEGAVMFLEHLKTLGFDVVQVTQ